MALDYLKRSPQTKRICVNLSRSRYKDGQGCAQCYRIRITDRSGGFIVEPIQEKGKNVESSLSYLVARSRLLVVVNAVTFTKLVNYCNSCLLRINFRIHHS